MEIIYTDHAEERMQEYRVQKDLVEAAIKNPDSILEGYSGRKICQKKLNGYTLRVIVEESKEIIRVITLYKAKGGRYGV